MCSLGGLPMWSRVIRCFLKVPSDDGSQPSAKLSPLQSGSFQHFRASTICVAHGVIKKTIWDLAVENGPGRRCYPHSGLFLFADHLSHPRQDAPSEHFQGETLGLSLGPSGGSKGQKWFSLRFPFLTLACGAPPRAEWTCT